MKRDLCLKFLLTALLSAACLAFGTAAAEIEINEIMASTAIVVDGQDYDWIELHNSGSEEVSLRGWYLSDDPRNPTAWPFPDTAKIDAKGYLVVYCAGDAAANGTLGTLHANFKLSSEGERICLTDPDGNTLTHRFGPQYGNISYGVPKGGMDWYYLEFSTPGAENCELGFEERAGTPVIETEAGFYESDVTVSIRTSEDTQIRYTTDGSEPGRGSTLYTGAFSLTRTTVVRARCFREDLLGSATVGSTFFINDPPIAPVVSIYSDHDYLFGSETGMLIRGLGKTANYDQDWEYPVQVEYFDEDANRCLTQMGTMRVTGNSSRTEMQKSITLYARKAYGSDTFNYSFFVDREYTAYPAILLRSGGSDSRFSRLRDEVFSQMSEGLGLYNQAAKPIIVYINGKYYGQYNLREKPNKDSLAQWEGITDEKLIEQADILEMTGTKSEQVIRGDNEDWVKLMAFCRENDLNVSENLQFVLDQLDVDSLFNYVIFNMMIGNSDTGNVRMYRFPGEKWKFLLHDIEAGCTNDKEAPVSTFLRPKTSPSATFPHWVLGALMEVPEYRDRFLRSTARIVQSHFLYDLQVGPIFEKWENALSPLMTRHISVFKTFTHSEWATNVRAAMFYARVRPKKVLGYIATRMGLTVEEQEAYFGEALALLAVHNAPR